MAAADEYSTTANGPLRAMTSSTRHRLLVGVRRCSSTAMAAAPAPMTAKFPVSDGSPCPAPSATCDATALTRTDSTATAGTTSLLPPAMPRSCAGPLRRARG